MYLFLIWTMLTVFGYNVHKAFVFDIDSVYSFCLHCWRFYFQSQQLLSTLSALYQQCWLHYHSWFVLFNTTFSTIAQYWVTCYVTHD